MNIPRSRLENLEIDHVVLPSYSIKFNIQIEKKKKLLNGDKELPFKFITNNLKWMGNYPIPLLEFNFWFSVICAYDISVKKNRNWLNMVSHIWFVLTIP